MAHLARLTEVGLQKDIAVAMEVTKGSLQVCFPVFLDELPKQY